MRSLALRIVIALVAAVIVTTPAQGQGRRAKARRAAARASIGGPEIGGHLGYNFDIDRAFFGVQVSFPVARRVEFYPSFDYYAGSGGTAWALNIDLKLRPPARYQFWYGGTGLNLFHAGSTSSHLNLFAGFAGRPGPFRPYAEARLTLFDGSSFQLAAGLSFPLR